MSAVKTDKQPIYLKDYRAPDFKFESVCLHFEIEQAHTQVASSIHVERTGEAGAPLILDGDELELVSVTINGNVLNADQYQLDDKQLQIPGVPDQFELAIVVKIYPKDNTSLMGLYESSGNLCTQCEPHGFRRITYFMDRPDVMTRFTTTVSADRSDYPHLLSNGNLIEAREIENGRHWVKWEDPSLKPCYLFALVAGNFDVLQDSFTTCGGREVQIRFYLEPGYGERGRFGMESLIRSMKWDEEAYGREYDLDVYMVVAVSDFNFGAMENKGLNIFNTSCVLASADQATDDDFIRVEDVIGHEYFHNWSGNRITCRDWFQLTLKEGLTVFRDQCFSEDMTKSELIRLQEVALVRTAQFAEDASPLAHPIRPPSYIEMNNFYTHTVYRKGAEVIRMLHTFMGAEKFRQAMDLYFKRYDGMAVTTDDFLAVMVETDPNIDLDAFLNWYNVAGTPILEVTSHYDADKQTYTLDVTQKLRCGLVEGEQQPQKPFYFPLAMGLLSQAGEQLPMQLAGESEALAGTRVLVVKDLQQQFVFTGVSEQPVPSLLRRFSAPIDLRYDYSDDELYLLWQCDNDAFLRDLSRQDVLTRVVLAAADAHAAGLDMQVPEKLTAVLGHLLDTKTRDANIQSQLLMMPTAAYVLQHAAGRSLTNLSAAYLFLKERLATDLRDKWMSCYERNATGAYQFDVVSMGARRLQAACLVGMCGDGAEEALACAFEHFKGSDNMTDTMSALAALNDHDSAWRSDAMQLFLSEWENESLVLCKWLVLQATQRNASVLDKVKEISESDLFDWRRPNIVNALFGAFARNWWGFHREDGEGYKLMTAAIEKLNKTNPQLAARLVRPMSEWQSLDHDRQLKLRAQLKHIAEMPDVSPDVYEIASKSM
jgi:aminopeptidase N